MLIRLNICRKFIDTCINARINIIGGLMERRNRIRKFLQTNPKKAKCIVISYIRARRKK